MLPCRRLPLTVAALAAGVLLSLLGAAGCGHERPQPNIVMVVLDTVRNDLQGLDSARQRTRLSLDKLASESTVFRNAWATAPWTVPSHASFFTGLLPSGHGCTHQHPRFTPPGPCLAELLDAGGYETAAFFSNPWLSDQTTGLLKGFQLKRESPLLGGLQQDPGRYRGDQGGRGSVAYLRDWLRNRKSEKPFFAFVNLLEAHLPYDPPPSLRQAGLPGVPADDWISGQWGMEYQAGLHPADTVDWPELRALYWADVLTDDQLLGHVMQTLDQLGLAQNTVLIVVSDHGENLGEHGLVDHQFAVNETLLSVPLMIRAPGLMPIGERRDPVMLTDLFATVVELAGLKKVEIPGHSRSLLGPPATDGRPLIAEYARPQADLLQSLKELNPDLDLARLERGFRTIRVGDLRLTEAEDGTVELNDLAADPGQETNLAPERQQDVAALEKLMLSVMPEGGATAPEAIPLDEATRARLRSLGYVR